MPPKRRKISHPTPKSREEVQARADWEPAFTVKVKHPAATTPSSTKKKTDRTPSKSQSQSKTRDENFETYQSSFDERLDVEYAVELDGQVGPWDKMRTYRAFQLAPEDKVGPRIEAGQAICIRGDEAPVKATKRKSTDDGNAEVNYTWWYAQVLECRAEDPQHVYARIAWLYRPEDLEGGRKPYHGSRELIPSNDMQIINCSSVGGRTLVEKWDERTTQPEYVDDDTTPFIWRQTIDIHSRAGLSKLQNHCICDEPANPDQALIHCPSCDRHLHHSCLTSAALAKVAQLGPDPDLANGHTNDLKAKLEDAGRTTTPPPAPIAAAGEDQKEQSNGATSFGSRIYESIMSPFKSASREPSAAAETSINLPFHDSKPPAETNEAACTLNGSESVPHGAGKRKHEDVSPSQSQPNSSQRPAKKKGRPSKGGATATPTPKMSKAQLASLSVTVRGVDNGDDGKHNAEKDGTKAVEIWTDARRLVRVMDLRCLFADCDAVIP